MKINIPIGTKVKVKYQDRDENYCGVIAGKITNIFNGLIYPGLVDNKAEVAGIYVEKWIENGQELEIKRGVNDKVNIYKQDIIVVV